MIDYRLAQPLPDAGLTRPVLTVITQVVVEGRPHHHLAPAGAGVRDAGASVRKRGR
jgi:hypothetical protein